MVIDCPSCAAVAAGGRIRVTELSAADLRMGAVSIKHQWLQLRRLAIDSGAVESAKVADDHLKALDFAVEELDRTSKEKGWTHGEPQRSHS